MAQTPEMVGHPDTIRGPIEEFYNAARESIEAGYTAAKHALEATREANLIANEAAKSAALAAAGLNPDGSVPGDWPETADPECTDVPTVTGDNQVGVEQTASSGTWTHSPAFAYQWERADNAEGSNHAAIQGAIASKYTLVAADAGKAVRVRVTGSNSFGHHVAVSDYVVIEPLNLTLPTVSGAETVGEVLTATPATWSGEDTTVYQWGRADNDQGLNAVDIAGEQDLTYTLAAEDIGKYIRFLESAYNDGGDTSVSSVYHGPVVVP